MRLIDADKSKPYFDDHLDDNGVVAAMNAIEEMPIVDAKPVRHGRWCHLGGDEWCCSCCGDVIHTEGSWEKPTKNYCSECGAKMDAEVQHEE